MTARERANNILTLCDVDRALLKNGVFDAVVAEISESELEAKLWQQSEAGMTMNWKDGFDKGWNVAREEAKGIASVYGAEAHCPLDGKDIDAEHWECRRKTILRIMNHIEKMEPEK